MEALYLLRESTADQIEILNENTAAGSATYIEGPFISCNMKNRNGRVYGKAMMEQVVEDYQNQYINKRRALGEFIHPDYPMPNPKKAAIRIDSLTWQGDLVIGKAKILEKMDEGRILKNLIDEGIKLGVSTRGMGRLGRDKIQVENYRMNAVDAVDLPSGQPCYFDVLNESTLWYPTETGGWQKVDKQTGEVLDEATQQQKSEIDYTLFMENLDKAMHKKIYG